MNTKTKVNKNIKVLKIKSIRENNLNKLEKIIQLRKENII